MLLSSQDQEATYYHPSLHGNQMGCFRGDTYNRYDADIAAVSPTISYHYPCGATIIVSGPQGTIQVTRRDICPGCRANHIDLSEAAFEQVCGPLSRGRCRVTFE